jgi:hypothetical protein
LIDVNLTFERESFRNRHVVQSRFDRSTDTLTPWRMKALQSQLKTAEHQRFSYYAVQLNW